MIKQLKTFTINIIAGANVATVLLMVASGYGDHIQPTVHPMLSNLGMLFPFFLFANLLFVFFWLTFKWKRLWIPILGYVLVFSPICTVSAPASTMISPGTELSGVGTMSPGVSRLWSNSFWFSAASCSPVFLSADTELNNFGPSATPKATKPAKRSAITRLIALLNFIGKVSCNLQNCNLYQIVNCQLLHKCYINVTRAS